MLTLPKITLILNYIVLNNFHILVLACMMLQVWVTPPLVYLQSKPIKKKIPLYVVLPFFSPCYLSSAAFEVYVPQYIFVHIDTFIIFIKTLHGFFGTLLAISTRKLITSVIHYRSISVFSGLQRLFAHPCCPEHMIICSIIK